MKWARLSGPRRLAGTNPRARGTDLRTRLAQPRALAWPTNPRFQAAAYDAARAPLGPVAPPLPARPHRKSRQLLQYPWSACAGDSGWRRRAASVSGPCAGCEDTGWAERDGAVPAVADPCLARVTPEAVVLELEPSPWDDQPEEPP